MHTLELGLCAPGPCPPPVFGEPGLAHLVLSLGQPSLHDGWRLAMAPHSFYATNTPWGICPLT